MSAYAVTLGGTRYAFHDLRELMAKASPLRSGDQLAGIAAANARERAAAQTVLADVPLQRFLGSMPGYLPGTALEAKLVAVFPGNHERGLPSHQALIALFDEETGVPLCLMDGTVVTVNGKWNNAYYGKSVTPVDILVRHSVTNPGAGTLIEEVANAAK